MKALNLGNSDFRNVILDDSYYVDKSLFIEEIIEAQMSVILLPRPRRFGKTLNLSMLRYFFDKSEENNPKLFEALKIWQTEDKIKQHCGKYAVIYLTFKDVKSTNWEDALEALKSELSNAYRTHIYLLKGDLLHEFEKEEFNKILNKTASIAVFEESIKRLSDYLHRFHKTKIVILIDEYDAPIQSGYKNYYDKIIPFMRGILSGAFKDNPHLYRGVITGILRVGKENIFSGLNNVITHTILSDEFSDKFGFTEVEVKQIMQDFEIKELYSSIESWYNGYRFGNNKVIYNPWSILNFVVSKSKRLKPYWTRSSSNDLIKASLFERDYEYIKENFEILLAGGHITKKIKEDIIFPDLEDKRKELIWSLLYFTGYLKAEPLPEQAKTTTEFDYYNLSIPNKEVNKLFRDIIADWLGDNLQITASLLYRTATNLVKNNLEGFEKDLQKLMADTFSYFDKRGTPENAFHSYMLGLLTILGEEYVITSNRESGEGRYDIQLRPFNIKKNGVIIELKSIKSRQENESSIDFEKRVNKAISEAERQIEIKEYDKELKANKIKNIIKLAIVFAGKKPFVKSI